MSNVIINDAHLNNIASAIRNKNGTETKYKPGEMSTAINKIEDISEYIDTSLISDSVNYLGVRLIKKMPYMDTSEVTNMSYMFSRFSALNNLQEIDASKVTNINAMFASCLSLVRFGGLKNLGMAFSTTAAENYANYTLTLNNTDLDHDSLMNVINGLYDIASLGVKKQKVVLGSTLLSKLSDEELKIATNKGWVIS